MGNCIITQKELQKITPDYSDQSTQVSQIFCDLCGKYTDHNWKSCTLKTLIYHATSKKAVDSIQKNGFHISQGRLGSGVYFTLNFQQAYNIAKHKFRKQGVILQCYGIYDQLGKHPAWAQNDEFDQVCIKNSKLIKIVSKKYL